MYDEDKNAGDIFAEGRAQELKDIAAGRIPSGMAPEFWAGFGVVFLTIAGGILGLLFSGGSILGAVAGAVILGGVSSIVKLAFAGDTDRSDLSRRAARGAVAGFVLSFIIGVSSDFDIPLLWGTIAGAIAGALLRKSILRRT